MKKYRVLMEDSVNGQNFNFAVHYRAASNNDAITAAYDEFPDARFVDICIVPPTLQELLGAVK